MNAAPVGLPARFSDWVAEQQRQDPAQRKGERTRDRIRLATVELLNEVGYREMKVADVCARAKVTPPVLYLYFQHKQALTSDVLREFLDAFLTRHVPVDSRSAYGSIVDANLRWIMLARANAGLMRCLLQLSEEVPEFATIFSAASDAWYQRIAQSVVRRFPSAKADTSAIQLVAHAMGSMMDELTRKLFAGQDSQLQQLTAEVAHSDHELAHFLSVIWHRALYACDPDVADLALPVAPRLAAAARRRNRRSAS